MAAALKDDDESTENPLTYDQLEKEAVDDQVQRILLEHGAIELHQQTTSDYQWVK